VVRLIAAIPPPRFHFLRYFGVLSSHSSLRAAVVPRPALDPAASCPPPAAGDQLELPGSDADALGTSTDPPPRKRWACLLRHVLQADLEHCPRCDGPSLPGRPLAAATRAPSFELLDRGLMEKSVAVPPRRRASERGCPRGSSRVGTDAPGRAGSARMRFRSRSGHGLPRLAWPLDAILHRPARVLGDRAADREPLGVERRVSHL
jgi:hypothetical protein